MVEGLTLSSKQGQIKWPIFPQVPSGVRRGSNKVILGRMVCSSSSICARGLPLHTMKSLSRYTLTLQSSSCFQA
jgi:hypothetical protein